MRIDSAFRKGSLALCKMVMTGIQVESLGSMPSLVLEKRSLRRSVQSKLKGLDVATKQTESEAIQSHILESPLLVGAKTIAIYVHCERLNEVDTSALLETQLKKGDVKVFVPVVQDKAANMTFYHLDTLSGLRPVPPYNILEPGSTYENGEPRENVLNSIKPLDLMFVPGLAFDRQGRRLGRGGGYYDKFIQTYLEHSRKQSWKPPRIVGLAFRTQVVDSVPTGPTDMAVDCIATADGIITPVPDSAVP